MTEEDRTLCRVLSFLLEYPTAASLHAAEELRADGIADWTGGLAVQSFVDYLRSTPLIRLQEIYTATFDLSPSTSLNLSYHRWGNGRERGSALVRLLHLYARADYEVADGELPDYLPLVLEFLSVCSPESARKIMAEYLLPVSTLASRLAESGSPYAGIVQHAAHLFTQGEMTLTGG
jgi:nitrate reductase delta subunit